MIIKVKHDELNDVSNTIKKDSEDYDVEIEMMLNSVELLKNIWQGDDASIFCDNFTDYLTRMKGIPVTLRKMSEAIDTANEGYQEFDESFSSKLVVEANDYEE